MNYAYIPFDYFIGTLSTATGIIIGTQMAGLIPPSLLFPRLVTDPGSEYDIIILNKKLSKIKIFFKKMLF